MGEVLQQERCVSVVHRGGHPQWSLQAMNLTHLLEESTSVLAVVAIEGRRRVATDERRFETPGSRIDADGGFETDFVDA